MKGREGKGWGRKGKEEEGKGKYEEGKGRKEKKREGREKEDKRESVVEVGRGNHYLIRRGDQNMHRNFS